MKSGIGRAELVKKLAAEMADVLTYLDLLADSQGVDLAAAYIETFNAKSDQIGSAVKFE
jgi:NTP pyrophosphatase (non-canonical NTP hydrolase)